MATTHLTIGHTYITGNAFNPELNTVLETEIAFDDLPAMTQAHFLALTSDRTGREARRCTYIKFSTTRKHDVGAPQTRYMWTPLALACWFDAEGDFYADRAAAPGPVGMLRSTLPGER